MNHPWASTEKGNPSDIMYVSRPTKMYSAICRIERQRRWKAHGLPSLGIWLDKEGEPLTINETLTLLSWKGTKQVRMGEK